MGSTKRYYFTINNQKYSHIINPKTGYPIKTNNQSATIVANTCLEADALATAALILGEYKFDKILKKYPKIKVYFN